jgi:glucose dehydrogenase
MPTGGYDNQRYSKLNQITAANVGKLQVAWTFSTGVLRGHEGGPLIVGNMMYVHTPFPNKVYALDLSKDNQIVWKYEPKQDPNVIPVMCCDTVNRGVARCQDRPGGVERQERRSQQGLDRNFGADRRQGQGPDRHLRR